eukprot:7150660-Pyramimonas_sp.AAC.1
MHKRVIKYVRATRRHGLTSRLEQQGAQAAGAYGHQLHGVFGNAMTQFPKKLGNTLGPIMSGRCLTTL